MQALHRTLVTLSAVGMVHMSPSFAAEFSRKCDDESCAIQLKGNIERGDTEKFRGMLEELNEKGKLVEKLILLSRGGDVSEALKIGRIVRDSVIFTYAPQVNTYAPPLPDSLTPGDESAKDATLENQNGSFKYFASATIDGVSVSSSKKAVEIMTASGKPWHYDGDVMCASACALIAIAGLIRFGTIGLHHMSVDDEKIDYNDLDRILSQSTEDVASYLSDMRAPQSLLEGIVSTPSREIKWVDLYEIGSLDAILQEYADGKCGGLTDEQFRDMLDLEFLNKNGQYFDMEANQLIERSITKAELRYLEELESASELSSKCHDEIYLDAQRTAQGLK